MGDSWATPTFRGVHLIWGPPGRSRQLLQFDHDLELLDAAQTISTKNLVDQLGTTVSVDSGYWTFTGDSTNRQVALTRRDKDWQEVGSSTAVVPSEGGNSWNWFPSGVAHHTDSDTWFIAYTHMNDEDEADEDASIRLAVLDGDLVLQETFDVTANEGFTRPHLALYNDTLFLTYDGGRVYIERFEIDTK